MKVALIGPTYPFRGGIAHHTTLLYETISKNHETLFISFTRQYPDFLFPGKSDKDPSHSPYKTEKVIYLIDSINPFTWEKAVKKIRTFNPDKIIFPWWVAYFAPLFWYITNRLKKSIKCEIVIICHNVLEHDSGMLSKFISKLFLPKGDRLITHSISDSIKIRQITGANKNVMTLFHPTYAPLCDIKISREKARDQLGLSGNLLLFFGFIRPYKGLSVLLSAMKYIIEKKPVHLIIAGEFWHDKKKYLAKINKMGLSNYITIIDEYIPNENMDLFFSAVDLVVQPYLTASGSGVCQMAYGFGCPVIATSVGNLSEIIEDGINGRIVAPDNIKELSEAILESLEPEILHKLTQNAKIGKNKFLWDDLVKNIMR